MHTRLHLYTVVIAGGGDAEERGYATAMLMVNPAVAAVREDRHRDRIEADTWAGGIASACDAVASALGTCPYTPIAAVDRSHLATVAAPRPEARAA